MWKYNWPKYREWYFKIVIREIWDNFEISRVLLVLVPNSTCKSCYYLFILLLTKSFVIFMITCRYFELSWNTTALSQSNCRNFWCGSIIGLNTANDISKLLYVKFETILKYHECYWYWCQIAPANHAIICLYYYSQKVL